ncbi:hypothetical protein [Streptomyces sp. S.PNR 29]|uniref:hypothetical protein n=1 Tax=Streptomyces sp. S.PNR 29 TaxID=2973805 RepID=UPI0025B0CF6E|nr:hypothetical protein [Streptomyces sp. S.PNR 29]MDN0200026.1 hypothetical protein [Streptomyces sp. S.PNR 29]
MREPRDDHEGHRRQHPPAQAAQANARTAGRLPTGQPVTVRTQDTVVEAACHRRLRPHGTQKRDGIAVSLTRRIDGVVKL